MVTMNQSTDIDLLAERGLVAPDWRKRFPHGAAPYTTTSVFLVRKGNPKKIADWADLARPGLAVIIPNPKTSGNGRYTYLAAWGSVMAKGGTEAQARDFVGKLLANVPVLDGGGRGATTTFTQRNVGDVLVTFENEAALIAREVGAGQFDLVYPSVTIEAEAPVAVVEKVVGEEGHAGRGQGVPRLPVQPGRPGDHRQARLPPARPGRPQGQRAALPAGEDLHRRVAVRRLGQGLQAALRRRRRLRPADRPAAMSGGGVAAPAAGARPARRPRAARRGAARAACCRASACRSATRWPTCR